MDFPSLVQSDDVIFVAQRLLGATISTSINSKFTSGIIVETEAYRAPDDRGSHAFGNKRTPRTETMFGRPGRLYVYLCYGIHHLVNVVSGPVGTAHAILIRAIEPTDGVQHMLERRGAKSINVNLTNGPGKLSSALGIRTSHNAADLIFDQSLIKVQLGLSIQQKNIIASPRVGIAYAGEWAHQPWRFRIKDNRWTSLPHTVSYN